MFEIAFKTTAAKTLRRLQPKQAADFRTRIAAVAADPDETAEDVAKMKGAENQYRLRVRNWRILFELDREARTMTIVKIRTRGDVYK